LTKLDVLDLMRKNPFEWFTIRELCKELNVSSRSIRRSVFSLEAGEWIVGRCRGNYNNWNREFRFNSNL
jgi:hypothetical protein